MSWLGFALNLLLLGGFAFAVWVSWKWREAAHRARFRLEPLPAPIGPWVRPTQWILVALILFEVVLAFARLVRTPGTFAEIVSGAELDRFIVAGLLVVFLFVFRAGPLSGVALLRDEGIQIGWAVGVRYADVQDAVWLEGDVLVLQTVKARLYFRAKERDRESVARFLSERTGRVVPLPASPA
jgi:uncharacterized membrane protein YobD (UPF0266 family)